MDNNSDGNYYDETTNKVIELTTKDFKGKTVINENFNNKYGLIKAYAPWCGWCKKLKEDLKFLSNGLFEHNFQIGAINCQAEEELKSQIGVRGYPSLYMVNPDGTMEEATPQSRSVEDILSYICEYTNTHSKRTAGKCCKKVGDKIIC